MGATFNYEDYLAHHGIKGQKWGVRRFQNPDGSLTEAGKKKYLTSDGSLSKEGLKQFKKESNKLEKLQDRADIEKQKANIEKYGNRAKTAAKVGLASGAASLAVGVGGEKALITATKHFKKISDINFANYEARDRAISRWAERAVKPVLYDHSERGEREFQKVMTEMNRKFDDNGADISRQIAKNNATRTVLSGLNTARKVATVATAGVAAGSAAVYIHSRIKKSQAQKLVTDVGHAKAKADVDAQMKRMKNMFGTTKLSDIEKRYKVS